MNNIALQLIAIGQFCKWRLLKPCFRQLVSCTSCVKAFCSFFHGGRQESGAGNNESSVCSSSPMVYSPLEGPHHGCIEQISLRGSVDSSYDISGGKNGDRKSLLLERKQSDEVESRFFQKRDFPLPGSEQHEKIRNKLRKYIQETFLGNEGVSSNEIDEKECVLCLDTFTYDNPKQLTLCACGENRTLFHYQCLIEWLAVHDHCPSCQSKLYYQERA